MWICCTAEAALLYALGPTYIACSLKKLVPQRFYRLGTWNAKSGARHRVSFPIFSPYELFYEKTWYLTFRNNFWDSGWTWWYVSQGVVPTFGWCVCASGPRNFGMLISADLALKMLNIGPKIGCSVQVSSHLSHFLRKYDHLKIWRLGTFSAIWGTRAQSLRLVICSPGRDA